MNADIETLKMGIKHLPPTARRRAERALGIPPSEPAEHKVFVYGTLLSNECNCHRAPRARRQKAWTLGTLHDTGYGFPAIVLKGRTRIVGEVLTVDEDAFRSMDRLEGGQARGLPELLPPRAEAGQPRRGRARPRVGVRHEPASRRREGHRGRRLAEVPPGRVGGDPKTASPRTSGAMPSFRFPAAFFAPFAPYYKR